VTPDIFGDVFDVDGLEQAALATLKAWLPSHLAHQETRRGFPQRTIPQPRSWPTVDEFDPEPHEQLPSIVLVSPGTTGDIRRGPRGTTATWRLEVVVAVAGRDEREVRLLRSVYAAAVRSALEQNGKLAWQLDDDRNPVPGPAVAERTRWDGDAHAFGRGRSSRGPRAHVEVAFLSTVSDVVNPRLGPPEPPDDPYDPPVGDGLFTGDPEIDVDLLTDQDGDDQ
jgi:hypothetical protein